MATEEAFLNWDNVHFPDRSSHENSSKRTLCIYSVEDKIAFVCSSTETGHLTDHEVRLDANQCNSMADWIKHKVRV